jgi:ribosomal protein S18 acetylase RimI-like enzyme
MHRAHAVREADWPGDAHVVRTLFEEYAASLGFSLCFQDFDRELAELPGDYAPPRGVVLLADEDDACVGCVALRPIHLSDQRAAPACEMKRLYVRPAGRGTGVGRQLCEHLIGFARAAGYRRMLLDTVATMHAAIGLYRALGFVEIAAYRHNPLPDVRYFELPIAT